MKKWLRRIRGAIKMGLTWAVAWFGAGIALLLVVGFGAADVPFPLAFGVFGFMAGAAFSTVLAITEGGRRFEQMSMPRFAVWGGVAGLVLAGVFVGAAAIVGDTTPLQNLVGLAPIFALAGAGSAAGSLALARKAEKQELLDAGTAPRALGKSPEP